uniref:Uncharacterized protein n=1 Tax=Anopheles atroparvus TaxID=41427 RepID=A0A182JAB6_ANOAO
MGSLRHGKPFMLVSHDQLRKSRSRCDRLPGDGVPLCVRRFDADVEESDTGVWAVDHLIHLAIDLEAIDAVSHVELRPFLRDRKRLMVTIGLLLLGVAIVSATLVDIENDRRFISYNDLMVTANRFTDPNVTSYSRMLIDVSGDQLLVGASRFETNAQLIANCVITVNYDTNLRLEGTRRQRQRELSVMLRHGTKMDCKFLQTLSTVEPLPKRQDDHLLAEQRHHSPDARVVAFAKSHSSTGPPARDFIRNGVSHSLAVRRTIPPLGSGDIGSCEIVTLWEIFAKPPHSGSASIGPANGDLISLGWLADRGIICRPRTGNAVGPFAFQGLTIGPGFFFCEIHLPRATRPPAVLPFYIGPLLES